jgi:hypothetical protein
MSTKVSVIDRDTEFLRPPYTTLLFIPSALSSQAPFLNSFKVLKQALGCKKVLISLEHFCYALPIKNQSKVMVVAFCFRLPQIDIKKLKGKEVIII